VQAAFTQGLRDEQLLEVIEARSPDGSVPYDPDDDRLPVLLVMSDIHTGSAGAWPLLLWSDRSSLRADFLPVECSGGRVPHRGRASC
jgi:hypothetical protein